MLKYNNIFSDGISKVKGMKAKLRLEPDAHHKFRKARIVPVLLKPKLEVELENLEREGIISKASMSE